VLGGAPISGYFAFKFSESCVGLRDESAAFLIHKGQRATATELIKRRRECLAEVTRLTRLHEERFGGPRSSQSRL